MPKDRDHKQSNKPAPSSRANLTQLPRAVLYLRSASAKLADRDMAIVAQQHNCLRRANELGAQVVGEYVDLGSGLRAERPGLVALLAKLVDLQAEGNLSPTYVITHDHARIACDPTTYIRVVWDIEQAGARLVVASQSLVEYEAFAARPSEAYPDFPTRTFAADPAQKLKRPSLTEKED